MASRKQRQDAHEIRLIEPVPVATLRECAEKGQLDPGVKELLDAELDYIRRVRPGASADDLAGLALSGGGIRSATFALGVMQALAREGVLARMDYLSTVSGGGYIGSALTWFVGPRNADREFGLERKNFPWGIDSGDGGTPVQAKMLNWLRQHGNYLTPGKGITLLSVIAIVLRGFLLNLVVWVPILVALFWLLLWASDVLVAVIPTFPVASAPLADRGLVPAMLGIAVILGLVFAVYSLAYSFLTAHKPTPWQYGMRLRFDKTARWLLWITLSALVLASFPYADAALKWWLKGWLEEAGGPLAAVLGLLSGLWSFLRTRGSKDRPLPVLVPAAGAALIVYGVELFSFQLALTLPANLAGLPWWCWLALGFAVASGIIVNINFVSIHRFYRDRLMETFLPDAERALTGETGAARTADLATIQSTMSDGSGRGPYHILNANVVLAGAVERRWRLRGGDNFVFTRYHCGSCATGWIDTERFLGGRLTLATAMAISGAAANPNTGGGGVGLTRNRSVSLLMALLNLRLGYWCRSPRYGAGWFRPNHFIPGLVQAFGLHKEDSRFIEISDGGHFDNLALYELIRRRLRLIILCDGAADPKFGFADLNTLRRRIAADFGARIHFDLGEGTPEDLIPNRLKALFPDGAGYATDGDMAERGYLLARISYADGSTGVLVYIKTTLVKDVSFGVKAYKGAHPDFPDETTADQFFDEEQFDAYRELGNFLAGNMLRRTGLAATLDQIAATGKWPPPKPRAKRRA